MNDSFRLIARGEQKTSPRAVNRDDVYVADGV